MSPWSFVSGISRLRLAYKYSLAVLLIIISMGSGIYSIADRTISQNLHDVYRQKGEAITSNLAANAANLILVEDRTRLHFLLKNTKHNDAEIVYLFIIDSHGHVVDHTFPGGFPNDLLKIARAENDQPFSTQLLDTGEDLVLDISAPVLHGSLGVVHAGFSLKNIELTRRHSQQKIFWTCAMVSLLAIIISILMSRYITTPLATLAQGAEFIGKGNYDHRLDIVSNGEIGATAKAFNQMAESLQQDIAKRKETETALRKSEEIYRNLVENIDLGITLVDQDHKILMTNAAQGRLFNKHPNDFAGKKCFEEFEKRDQACSHCPGVAALESGCPSETITQGKRDDGSEFTVKIRAFPVPDETGQKKRFIEVVENISEQLKAQQDLAAEKERLAVTLRSIGDGVITTDTSGNIVLLNKVAESLTGWSNEEAMGRPMAEIFHIIHEHTREICDNPVAKVMKSGMVVGLANHTVLIARDGTELRIADSGAPICDNKSNIIGVVLVFRDVTAQMKTEQELLKMKKLESVGVLAGGIAHDFNNILAAILGNINLALFDKELNDRTKDLLSAAEKASLRAKDLTQQLLTFSKGGAPIKETSSLENIIKDSANFVLHGEKVTCQYYIPPNLWLVDIDKGQISQVIQNIVINANQAMPEGGIIEIRCENLSSARKDVVPFIQDGKFVKICIRDSGIGMPANIVEKIFDPYYSTKDTGNGLGLAITQSIITKHNGHISVESSPGVGTTFTIYLPASITGGTEHQESFVEEKAASKARIMIMDDDEIVRDIAKNMLDFLGHEVVLAKDGEEAIALFKDAKDTGTKFDLIIMDLTIPGGMGGQEAVKKILAIDSDAKVIVSSGYSNAPAMANFKDYGFCATIVKPYRLNELSKVINQVIAC